MNQLSNISRVCIDFHSCENNFDIVQKNNDIITLSETINSVVVALNSYLELMISDFPEFIIHYWHVNKISHY